MKQIGLNGFSEKQGVGSSILPTWPPITLRIENKHEKIKQK